MRDYLKWRDGIFDAKPAIYRGAVMPDVKLLVATFCTKSSRDLILELIRSHEEMRLALEGVIRVADRKTVEFDAARAALTLANAIGVPECLEED